jgi:hypothetical protein
VITAPKVVVRGLSLAQPYASLVALGLKTLETRKTRIHYRGILAICSTRTFDADAWVRIRAGDGIGALGQIMRAHSVVSGAALPLGKTLALVDVVGCRELVPEDLPRSFFFAPGRWAWELANPRRLKLRPVRGMNGLFPVADELVELEAAP